MRIAALAVGLAFAGCAHSRTPRGETMSSATLEHQDPGADTSHHEVLSRSESRNWFERLLGLNEAPRGPSMTPHQNTSYYRGCAGCAAGDGPGLAAFVVLALGVGSRRAGRRDRGKARV